MEESISNVTTKRTLNNIKKCLAKRVSDKDKANEILKVHGLHDDNFDYVKNVENLMNKKISDLSIDDNANKEEKTIKAIQYEAIAPINKLVGYDFLYREMKTLYGKKEAKRLSGLMYDYSLPIHDSSNLLNAYCWSFDATHIVRQGRPFGQLHSKEPKRIESYINSLNETIHQMTNHLAGAIAIGPLFMNLAQILIEEEKITYDELQDKDVRKRIENSLQSFVHSVNHLSRISNQSPFVNVSIFDEPKLKALIKDSLELDLIETGLPIDYWIEYVLELQRIFLDFFNKGDPTNDGVPYRFPVVTICISKDGNNNLLDESFAKEVSELDISRYNIYTSEGTKIASCCFRGDQEAIFKTKDGKIIADTFKNMMDKDYEYVLGKNVWKKFDKVCIDYNKPFYEIELFTGEKIICTDNHIFCTKRGDKRADELRESDFLRRYGDTEELLDLIEESDNEKEEMASEQKISDKFFEDLNKFNVKDVMNNYYFDRIKKVSLIPNEDKKAYCVNIKKGSPYFVLANRILTHNCRLINDAEMFELGGQVNSFGGSAISLGSHRVVLVHTNRIALETNSVEEFYTLLDKRLNDTAKILKAHKQMLIEETKNGLQPFISRGWINMEKMFSTFGLVALEETLETLGANNDESMKRLLTFINDKAKELSKKYELTINIEQVPAESMAVRLVKVDKLLFGEDKVPYELYSNQFVPLWKDVTLFERMEKDGKYNHYFSGGGIVHFNLGEKTTPTQNFKLIKKAVVSGCEHFALSGCYSTCENGHSSFGDLEFCPKCGGKIVSKLTRIVGFFTRVENWNPVRRKWEFPRRKFKKAEGL